MAKTVVLEDERVITIGDQLGDGTQGVVYKVKDTSGQSYALKLFKENPSKDFITNLRRNIARSTPHDSFLWPLGLTKPVGSSGRIGYLMNLYGREYTSFNRIIKGQAQFPSLEVLLATLIDLTEAFEKLHANGFSYQDLNGGGVVFNLQKGKVLILDNDNVSPDGVNLGILGTFKYMAPEVAIRMFDPDIYSDRFSIAVFIFMLLTHSHPLDGKKRLDGPMTEEKKRKLYGTNPVFIFDPNDTSNRPDPQIDANVIKQWNLLPDFIKDLFLKAFTGGMPRTGMKRDELVVTRQHRPTERQWREALYRWMDSYYTCPFCKIWVVADIENNAVKERKCPHCGKTIKVDLPIMVVSRNNRVKRTIVLDANKTVLERAVTEFDSNGTAFIVERSKDGSQFGIKNYLSYQWKCTQGDVVRLVKTGERVLALNDVNVEFDYTYKGVIYKSKRYK